MAKRAALSADAQLFNELFGKTSEVEPKLRAALRKRLKAAATAAAAEVKVEVKKKPLSGGRGRSRGLRAGIASGIKVTLSTSRSKSGVAIQATTSKVPDGQRKLVRAYNKPGGWRHPTFGHEPWQQQKGRPFFEAPIEANAEKVEAAVLEAMNDAIEHLST